MFDQELDQDGVLTLRWDTPGRPDNSFDLRAAEHLSAGLERAAGDENVKGIVIASEKEEFGHGVNVESLLQLTYESPADVGEFARSFQRVLRKLETCGKPVAAIASGSASGSALDLILACSFRIVATDAEASFSFPESAFGLHPFSGATQRLLRLIGIKESLGMLLSGEALSVSASLQKGVFSETAPRVELLSVAKRRVLASAVSSRPWDKRDFQIPDGGPMTPTNSMFITGAIANAHARIAGSGHALKNVLSCIYEGSLVDFDTGLEIEARSFINLATAPDRIARNVIRTQQVNLPRASRIARSESQDTGSQISVLGVLGAGVMGAGIAYRAAAAGVEVRLLDVSGEAANRGAERIKKTLDALVARKKMSVARAQEIIGNVRPTSSYGDLSTTDLVIEAVFEDRKVKRDALSKADAAMKRDAVLASNTSTLPITGLAQYVQRADRFLGMHYFSPVDRMQLVEVIKGEKTSAETLRIAADFVRLTKMTPIIVNDARSFYANRVLSKYLLEGLALLEEGTPPPVIERAGIAAGMPVSPLALLDEISIELFCRGLTEEKCDLGSAYRSAAGEGVAFWMVEQGRLGRRALKGFYDYDSSTGARQALWDGLAKEFSTGETSIDFDELVTRLLLVQSFEAIRCLEAGIVANPEDADVGAYLGWGFAPWTGGPISYVDTLGAVRAREKGTMLAAKVNNGERYIPPALLNEFVIEGRSFYPSAQRSLYR